MKKLFPILCLAGFCLSAPRAGELTLGTPTWRMTLDERSGAIREITDRTTNETLLRGGPNLWTIVRHEAPPITAATCSMTTGWKENGNAIVLNYTHPEAEVRLICQSTDDGPRWQADIRLKQGRMIEWRFPESLNFEVNALNQFIFPDHLGLAFTPSFFQVGDAYTKQQQLGGTGWRRVTAQRCQVRPVEDPPVTVRPGSDAMTWLPEWLLKEARGWRVTANRTPAEPPELSLLETEHGAWLSGSRLGGQGWLLRFGGMMNTNDERPRQACLVAVLSRLAHQNPPERTTIGVIAPRPQSQPGVGGVADPLEWLHDLQKQPWFSTRNLRIERIEDAAELRSALSEGNEWLAIVNGIPEGIPVENAARINGTLDAIRDYVRAGGTWWEAGGGYPFFHARVPAQTFGHTCVNRSFCDFSAVDSRAGRFALFGVQPPEGPYVPAQTLLTADGPFDRRTGSVTHSFHVYADSTRSCRTPMQQMIIGTPHRDALKTYAKANGFARGLADKAGPELAERLKRCVLLKVNLRTLNEATELARSLPGPVLFHMEYYLKGGFDKEYPDHLPPNPRVGTGDDLARLIRVCKENGHVFMPYTNPTWWCDNPKGPTFARVGDAPLSRDFNDRVYPETYHGTAVQGYSVCAWHPEARKAADTILDQFTKDYPVDVLFQDQVGARRHRWDLNPAAPSPGAYLEGMHRLARSAAERVPVGSEDGLDRLINTETMFCGLSNPWLPNRKRPEHLLYKNRWPKDAWRIEPLALYLAHDKVLFYHHDLGGFVRDRLDLSKTLVMGYGLSWSTHRLDPRPAEKDWLDRLIRLQAAIGPRCAGRALGAFDDLAPRVLRSRWGDLEIIANLSSAPWKVDNQTSIAPEGFLARSPDLTAGILLIGEEEQWIIRIKNQETWTAERETL